MSSSKSLIATIVLLMTICLSACGDKNKVTEPEASVPPQLAGTWLFQSATINGLPTSLPFTLEWKQGSVSARFTVSSNGSYLYEELAADSSVNWFRSGTFTVDGDSAVISVTSDSDGPVNPPSELRGTWRFEGEVLVLRTIVEGLVIELYAVKILSLRS